MATELPPVPRQAAPADPNSGFLVQVWSAWFEKAFNRMGGHSASTNAEIDALIAGMQPYLVPSGGIIPFAGTVAPTGYLLCDGSAKSRTTYAALFAVIGTSHGSGDGSTTFHLPDYRGRFLRGVDNGAGNDPDKATRSIMNIGGSTGDHVGTLQGQSTSRPTTPFLADSQGAHGSHWSGTIAAVQSGAGVNALTAPAGPTTLGGHTHTISSGGDTETRPINAYVNYLVKT